MSRLLYVDAWSTSALEVDRDPDRDVIILRRHGATTVTDMEIEPAIARNLAIAILSLTTPKGPQS